MGYSPNSKAYRLYDLKTRSVVLSRDATFDKLVKWNSKSEGKHELSDELLMSIGGTSGRLRIEYSFDDNPPSDKSDGEPSHHHSSPNNQSVKTPASNRVDASSSDTLESETSKGFSSLSVCFFIYETILFRRCNNYHDWIDAMKVEIHALKDHKTRSLTKLPKGKGVIGLKWVYKVKLTANEKLKKIANQLPDAFIEPKRVTKSHIPAVKAPIEIVVLEGQLSISNESNARLKRGRPIISKDKNPQKKKGANNVDGLVKVTSIPEKESLEETLDVMVPEEPQRSKSEYVIIAVYVNDLNIIGTPRKLQKAIEYLKREFEMKDLGKTKFCLGLQIEHLKDGILKKLTQKNYSKDFILRNHMHSPMVVRVQDVEKDPF
ncbi:uncharacterized protein LOC143632248 [Bidens hawaiensis]|uniref:uncharacterized protein LOC143632248 n=1 Tax=Bidens hawaiensis TaxID=980011 RepID=UPI00404B65F4